MRYKVLIVDDELLIREGLRRHIGWESLGMEVLDVADSGETALTIAERTPPDILITDICMRGKNGFDLIEDLLELGMAPQAILISSYNDFSYAQRAVRLDVVREYILKPVDTDHLTEILTRLRQELDMKHVADVPFLPQRIPLDTYRRFLCELRRSGFDRHRMVRYIKAGEQEGALALWQMAESQILAGHEQEEIVKRFCSSLLMTLISEGALTDTIDGEDPVSTLDLCKSASQMLLHIHRVIEEQCGVWQRYSHDSQSKLIATCLEIIEKRFCDPRFNLIALAAALDVTPNYLSMRFKAEMGVGFMKYLLDKQVEKAKLLLADPSLKVYQIAEQVGFQDEKYFSRQFKKMTGMTPKEWRNNKTSPV